jgi:hypothetical protein
MLGRNLWTAALAVATGTLLGITVAAVVLVGDGEDHRTKSPRASSPDAGRKHREPARGERRGTTPQRGGATPETTRPTSSERSERHDDCEYGCDDGSADEYCEYCDEEPATSGDLGGGSSSGAEIAPPPPTAAPPAPEISPPPPQEPPLPPEIGPDG